MSSFQRAIYPLYHGSYMCLRAMQYWIERIFFYKNECLIHDQTCDVLLRQCHIHHPHYADRPPPKQYVMPYKKTTKSTAIEYHLLADNYNKI